MVRQAHHDNTTLPSFCHPEPVEGRSLSKDEPVEGRGSTNSP
jgi:hypothetical protein